MRIHLLELTEVSGKDSFLTSTAFNQARELALRKEGLDLTEEKNFSLIPDYLNFGDTLNFLLGSKNKMGNMGFSRSYKNFSAKLASLPEIRNRVMHGRPLDFEDYETTVGISKALANDQDSWNSLYLTLLELKDSPNRFIDMPIPDSQVFDNHNLPLPDFDETGFIGRQDFLNTFSKLLKGPYPVITIIGEGGIGKTASTLKACYDFYDSDPTFFDRIIWVTAKSSHIGIKEIIEVKNSIKSSLDVFIEVSSNLGREEKQDPIKEVLEYLTEFRILLVLDNLETILDDKIKYFLSELPLGSKVVITSRIGVGNSEHRINLSPLSSIECVRLMKKLSTFRGVAQLRDLDHKTLEEYTKRLYYNPGFIKWFVTVASLGKTPESIFKDSDVFISFCMSNVFSYATKNAKKVLGCMQSLQADLSLAEISFIENMKAEDTEAAVLELCNTNMVFCKSLKRNGGTSYIYTLSPIARNYLFKKQPIEAKKVLNYQSKYRSILTSDDRFESTRNPFYKIRSSTNEERIVAIILSKVIESIKRKDLDSAEKDLEKAKALAPLFPDVYRIESYLKIELGDFEASEACLEKALELRPNCGFLLYTLGSFFVRYKDDLKRAEPFFRAALEKEPFNPYIILEASKCYIRLKGFDSDESLLRAFERCGEASPRNRIKYFDCRIDLKTREAEHYFENNQFLEFIEKVNDAINVWKVVPNNLRDRKMVERLLRKRPRFSFILKNSLDKVILMEAQKSMQILESL